MLKFLFLFVSTLFVNAAAPEDYLTVLSKNREEETVIAQAEEYRLVWNGSERALTTKDGSWRREVGPADESLLIAHNGDCLLFYYHDEYLRLTVYDRGGNKLYDGVLFDNPVTARWDVCCGNYIYVAGGVSRYTDERFISAAEGKALGGEDAFLARFDDEYNLIDVAVFGGEKNERFSAVCANGESVFLAGHKVPGGGGDFGNGGRYVDTVFVVSLDDELNISESRVLASTDKIVSLRYYKDRLFLVLSRRVYKFDDDLNTLHREDLEEKVIAACFSGINRLALFAADEGYIYNTYTFVREYVFTYPSADAIRVRNDAVALSTPVGDFLLDVACLRYFKPPAFYCPDADYRGEAHTLFGPARLLREESEPYFDPSVYGRYLRKYIYSTAAGLEFAVEREMEVYFEANVDEDAIYPLGYRLRFTGVAYLNGMKIINNYPLDEAGEYLLELIGANGETRRVRFRVASSQIKFSDLAVKTWDIETAPDSVFYFRLEYDGGGECEIASVVVNGLETDELIVDRTRRIIDVKMRAPGECGIHYYRLEKINYLYRGDYFSHDINKTITVNVLRPSPKLNLTASGGLEFKAELDDAFATARYFSLVAYSPREEIRKKYSLANNNIYLNGLSAGEEYQAKLFLVYNNGNGKYQEIELLEVTISGQSECKIGEIEILESEETLKRFNINLNKNAGLQSVGRAGEILYRKPKKSPSPAIMAAFGVVISFGIVFGIKKTVSRRRNKKSGAKV
ncbi:MAG TPA: hypothetical protein PLO54_03765 [Bacilli bacterium]|nr:hypothetical protein [Bacilli bacterium]